MTADTPVDLARSYWDAESRRDLTGVLRHYAEDAVLRIQGRTYRGKAEISTFYEANFAEFPQLEVEIVHDVTSREEASLEWEAVFTDRQGRRYAFSGVNVVRFENGLLTAVRPYFATSLPTAVET